MNMLLFNIILITYLAVTVFLGYLGYRGTKSVKDFMLAGRQSHPYVMAVSYGATFISTSAIVGFGGMAGVYGMGILWLPFLNILFGVLLAFIVFGKKTREVGAKLDAHTFPELLGKRYDSVLIQRFAGIVIFFFMPLYAGVVLIGAARFLETSLNLNFNIAFLIMSVIIALYVITGGLKAVLYTDTFQGTIMWVGMLFLLIITYVKLGGITGAHKALTDLAKFIPAKQAAEGFQGWTTMPIAGSVSWWTLVSTVVLGVGIGVLAQPQLSIRFMTVKSSKDLNRAVVIGGVFIFLMTFVPYVTGSLSNVYFYNTTGKLSLEAAGANIDKIIPTFINSIMPPWFVYIFMLTLLAAAMSTISAQFHVIGTSFARDVFRRYDYKTPEKDAVSTVAVNRRGLYYPKIGIVIGILISIALGYFLPTSIIAKGTSLFFGVCAATFLPVYIFALFWKGATRPGAIASMFTGLFSSLVWMLFINAGIASKVGLCKIIFGRDTLLGFPWNSVDAILIAFPLSFLVAYIVSLATKKSGGPTVSALPAAAVEK